MVFGSNLSIDYGDRSLIKSELLGSSYYVSLVLGIQHTSEYKKIVEKWRIKKKRKK